MMHRRFFTRLRRQVAPAAFATVTAVAALGCTAGLDTTPVVPVVAEKSDSDDTVGHTPAEAALPTKSSLADLVSKVSPSVVNITTLHTSASLQPLDLLLPEGRRPRKRQRTGAGTGFIIDEEGYVVTNAHVIQGADEVRVRLLDEREFTATVIGRDRKLDLALLKIGGPEHLPTVNLGDSTVLRVGESVLAVGNPFGLGHTVTLGIVSAKARAIGASAYDDFIQTDASINPGNSGGPLFNLRGEVIGINTAIRAGADGIGFAIPINALKDVLGMLKDKGFVERGKLGLAFQPLTSEIASALGLERPRGALVNEVMPNSAAQRAGIQPGDVIIGVDGVDIVRAEDLPRNVARHAPGSLIEVHILRDGKPIEVKARLDKLEGDASPPPMQPTSPKSPGSVLLGIELESSPAGVRIKRFAKPVKGLRVGDVIVEVNGRAVRSIPQVRRAVHARRDRGSALFKVKRGKRFRFVGVKLAL